MKSIQKAIFQDLEGSQIDVTWFNIDYIESQINFDKEFFLVGKLTPNKKKMEIISPEIEAKTESEAIHSARISPYYALTGGIKQKFLRSKIKE